MRPKIPSERIQNIVDMLKGSQRVYDLCCDHGLIGLLAWERDQTRQITFVDQSPNALEALQSELQKSRYQSAKIHVEIGPAEHIQLDQKSSIVIAGVGNSTIIRILDALFPKELDEHSLVLCSQQITDPLRKYLVQRAWPIQKEVQVIERGRVREIFLVSHSKLKERVYDRTDTPLQHGLPRSQRSRPLAPRGNGRPLSKPFPEEVLR